MGIIKIARKKRTCGTSCHWRGEGYRAPDWWPVSFVASTKAVLLRCLRENGAEITPEGQSALDTLDV